VPNDQKAKEIEEQMAKQGKLEQQAANSTPVPAENDEVAQLKAGFAAVKDELPRELAVEEFEKDNDANFHVDFVYAMANIRA
jgi:hypothetical protein